MNKDDREKMCPECGSWMKEFITMHRCRNLSCGYKTIKPIKIKGDK